MSSPQNPVSSATWMSVLALSLGVASARTTMTEIRGEAPSGRGPMRLVVQEYETDASGAMSRRARAFAQRKVTPAELRRGIQVELVDLSEKRSPGDRLVLAWVERGELSDEFDGRKAKPAPGSVIGKSSAKRGQVRLTLALGAMPFTHRGRRREGPIARTRRLNAWGQ